MRSRHRHLRTTLWIAGSSSPEDDVVEVEPVPRVVDHPDGGRGRGVRGPPTAQRHAQVVCGGARREGREGAAEGGGAGGGGGGAGGGGAGGGRENEEVGDCVDAVVSAVERLVARRWKAQRSRSEVASSVQIKRKSYGKTLNNLVERFGLKFVSKK